MDSLVTGGNSAGTTILSGAAAVAVAVAAAAVVDGTIESSIGWSEKAVVGGGAVAVIDSGRSGGVEAEGGGCVVLNVRGEAVVSNAMTGDEGSAEAIPSGVVVSSGGGSEDERMTIAGGGDFSN